jgi:signal peptidase II
MLLIFILPIILILLDQISKYAVKSTLGEPITILPKVFYIDYVENRGAAFGIFQNKQYIFILISIIICAAIIIYLIKYHKTMKLIMRFSLILIFSGAVGNLIDRIRIGYVIDFFDFRLINFPVFNFADIFIVVGCILFSFLLLKDTSNK